MNHVKQNQYGFTVIELMMAMLFISVLLLTIAMSIIQVASIYNKGMTLREVNEAGRLIGDQVRRDVTQGSITNLAEDYRTTSAGGRFCVGTYSYIWNYEPAITSSNSEVTTYETLDQPVRLVKVQDPGRAYCAKDVTGFVKKKIAFADESKSTELLQSGERFLSIYTFGIPSGSVVTDTLSQQSLYELSFVIGTGKEEALTDDKKECKVGNEPGADFNYCAVQEFTLVIRAGSGVN